MNLYYIVTKITYDRKIIGIFKTNIYILAKDTEEANEKALAWWYNNLELVQHQDYMLSLDGFSAGTQLEFLYVEEVTSIDNDIYHI